MPAGVYLIRNSITWRVYVGQSKRIERRWEQHIDALSMGKHHNNLVQSDWCEHGIESFTFSVAELVKKDGSLLYHERCWVSI